MAGTEGAPVSHPRRMVVCVGMMCVCVCRLFSQRACGSPSGLNRQWGSVRGQGLAIAHFHYTEGAPQSANMHRAAIVPSNHL